MTNPSSLLTGTRYSTYRNARNHNRISKASGPCCLCGRSESRDVPIVADHCHACGIIRGEICGNCNAHMRFADEAATAFASYNPEWLTGVNEILTVGQNPRQPTTLAKEINNAIDYLHYFLADIGASKVFAYQSQCAAYRMTASEDTAVTGYGRYRVRPALPH